MAGASCGLGLVVFLELLESGLRTSTQVEQRLGQAFAAGIPLVEKGNPIDVVVDRPLSVFAESFRKLKVFVQHASGSGPAKVLVMTSALPGEGKTTTTICFARSLALSGSKVIVVDCDTHIRSLSKLIATQAGEVGLVEVLEGGARLADAIIKDPRSDADVLPILRPTAEKKGLFDTARMRALLEVLRREYDFVILDCPPVLAVADSLVLGSQADGVVFLIRWRATSARAAQHAIAALRGAEANVLGVALTHVDMNAQAASGYGDSSYYYRKYQEYYVN